MKGPRTAVARRAIALHDGAPLGDRFHVRARWWSCPIEELAQEVPAEGRVLDLGCGHGLLSAYLALQAPGRQVVGVDIDAHKVELARKAADRLAPGEADVRFELVAPGQFAPGPWDAIVVTDVLYLMARAEREALLDACVGQLAPGGVVVLKEVDRRPVWKYRLTVAQELLSTRVLRITAGGRMTFAEPLEFVDQLRGLDLDVTGRRIDYGYLHPHVLVVGRR